LSILQIVTISRSNLKWLVQWYMVCR